MGKYLRIKYFDRVVKAWIDKETATHYEVIVNLRDDVPIPTHWTLRKDSTEIVGTVEF